MNACANYTCALYGCCGHCRGVFPPSYHPPQYYSWAQWPVRQAGCVCPPTSEQTCRSPTCPRREFQGFNTDV